MTEKEPDPNKDSHSAFEEEQVPTGKKKLWGDLGALERFLMLEAQQKKIEEELHAQLGTNFVYMGEMKAAPYIAGDYPEVVKAGDYTGEYGHVYSWDEPGLTPEERTRRAAEAVKKALGPKKPDVSEDLVPCYSVLYRLGDVYWEENFAEDEWDLKAEEDEGYELGCLVFTNDDDEIVVFARGRWDQLRSGKKASPGKKPLNPRKIWT